MAQMTITSAFETLKAQRELSGQTIVLDEFVLAYIPGLDPSLPIDRKEGLPSSEQIVFTADVTQSGFVNPNAVIYSLIMDTSVGDFEFNWIGLRNKEHGVLAAISHIPVINKIQSIPGVKNGNSVTRSMMMSYTGAKEATGITVDASTWQIDFTARLSGMDEVERLANIDHYGDAAFLDDGYQVFKSGSSYKVKQGTGYVGGLRCHAPADLSVSGAGKSMGIYLDASWQGGLTSQWQAVVSIKASRQALTDHVDSTGLQHYVTKLADIDGAGNVIDRRTLGGTPAFERHDNAAKNADIDSDSTSEKHVKLPQFWRGINKKVIAAFNGRQVNTTGALQGGGALSANRTLSIKDATTSQKGAVQLTDSVSSTSSSLGATAKAVKNAYDKAESANKLASSKMTQTKGDARYLLKGAKSADSEKLDNVDGSYYQRNDRGVIPVPQGGTFRNAVKNMTGVVKIALPVSWTSTMLTFTVTVYEYITGQSFQVQVSGYNCNSDGGLWRSCTASLISGERDVRVRFGHDGSNCCVYLGDDNESWDYVQVSVSNVFYGFTDVSWGRWASGWAIEVGGQTAASVDVTLFAKRSYSEGYKPTKSDVGLSYVNNWTATSNVNDGSESKYATARGLKIAHDKAVHALNVASQGLPTGIPLPWPKSTPPTGWLECRGQEFDKSTYPELAALYPHEKEPLKGRLPDLRGEFMRGWDHGRGVDVNRVILTQQDQDVKTLIAESVSRTVYAGASKKYGTYPGINIPGNMKIGTETRPRNIAFMYIVRAA